MDVGSGGLREENEKKKETGETAHTHSCNQAPSHRIVRTAFGGKDISYGDDGPSTRSTQAYTRNRTGKDGLFSHVYDTGQTIDNFTLLNEYFKIPELRQHPPDGAGVS